LLLGYALTVSDLIAHLEIPTSRLPDPDAQCPVDLHALLTQVAGQGSLWSYAGDDLQVNVVAWPEGGGVGEHRNDEVEVLILGIEGIGIVRVNGEDHELEPGQFLIMPKGSYRSIRSRSPRFSYLSVHRRRDGLWPAPRR
jgi:quercetin dioxygenase-like cupin family protein